MKLSRRQFGSLALGGAGALIALPFLRSLAPRKARAADPPRPVRMFVFYIPCGIHMDAWTPGSAGAGDAWQLSPILTPLASVKPYVSVLTGLRNDPANPDGPGDHAAGTGSFITAAHCYKTEGADIANGISMDQVAAGVLKEFTKFGSLELGIDGGSSAGGCDSGYSCAYARNISWADPTTPLAKTTDPQVAFDRLFAGYDPQATLEEIERRRRYKKSVLDYGLSDADSLRVRMGSTDQQKLDEYLTAVRELEMRLNDTTMICDPGPRPETGSDVRARITAMLDLSVLAFRCDLTRVISFMMANAGSGRVYDFLGISEGHHELSHHQGDDSKQAKLQTIDTWEVSQLAYLLEQMQAVENDDGTNLLDDAAVFFSSEIEDGNSHAHSNMPIVLAGKGGGAFAGDRHVSYSNTPSVANLFMSMLAAVGAPVPSFGDSTGLLEGLV
jgi:hypothetical protein